MSSNKKTKKRKNSFFAKHSKILKSFVFKISLVIISIGIFILIIYKAYKYALDPIDLQNIPLIKSTNQSIKKGVNQNDGLVFSNQDKVVYNDITVSNKSTKKRPKKISQDFSHQQIFDIVQDIKQGSQQQVKSKSQKDSIKDLKKKTGKKDQNKKNDKSIFQVLDTE